ncbi:2-hydroxyacid dehydrogenase [Jiella pelagia]|uniref:2-hydroxyacid dehydrogenase n=1 Tax=Jiella pelagia TaxID=2986949 RepID=A0ABY7BYL6_9HYPH|nr:2-hydroxyacid dehydrogenase [Jiella pelagia]WAP68634.1 2-hydroxyacid dehydrogenase [Jiella pelagia]
MKHEILLVEPMLAEIEARLDAEYKVVRLFEPGGAEAAEVAVARIRAVVTGGGTGLSAEWFDKLPELGLVAINGVGTDKVDLDLARRRGIHVSTTPGVLTDDVADLGMALILGVLRRLGEGDRLVRGGHWAQGGKPTLGSSLRGKRLGILGLGQIGRALGRRAEAFGMTIAYWNRSPVEAPGYMRCETPVALASDCDVLAICVAGTTATEKMVSKDVLAALGQDGVLVNVARGSVVDEDALIAALANGTIAGAGLDVFVGEPNIRREFQMFDNVLLMPHQGSATIETRRAMGELVLANLAAFFNGETPPNSVIQLDGDAR